MFLQASHKLGVLDHYAEDDSFAYECTELPNLENETIVASVVPKGTVIFHHCLTLHYSGNTEKAGQQRRHLVYQYRAKDALQLAGTIRRCNGTRVDDSPEAHNVRFEITENLKMIGNRRKLFDLHGKLKPNN